LAKIKRLKRKLKLEKENDILDNPYHYDYDVDDHNQ